MVAAAEAGTAVAQRMRVAQAAEPQGGASWHCGRAGVGVGAWGGSNAQLFQGVAGLRVGGEARHATRGGGVGQ